MYYLLLHLVHNHHACVSQAVVNVLTKLSLSLVPNISFLIVAILCPRRLKYEEKSFTSAKLIKDKSRCWSSKKELIPANIRCENWEESVFTSWSTVRGDGVDAAVLTWSTEDVVLLWSSKIILLHWENIAPVLICIRHLDIFLFP